MLEVRNGNLGWIELDTKDGDVVHLPKNIGIWLVTKASGKTWVVLPGDNETYWEVDTSAGEIISMMAK